MSSIDITERDAFLERMSQMYDDREALFQKREEEYATQKTVLTNMLEQIKKDKEELRERSQEQDALKKELDTQQTMLQEWYTEEVNARKKLKKLEEDYAQRKDQLEVQVRVELEEAKNAKIEAQQLKEVFEHKISLLGLLLDHQGEDGTKAGDFFTALLQGQVGRADDEPKAQEDFHNVLEEENKSLKDDLEEKQEQIIELLDENQALKQEASAFEVEKGKLLGLVAEMHHPKTAEDPGITETPGTSAALHLEEQNTPEGQAPPGAAPKPEVFEELTAPILKSYLQKNKDNFQGAEIRHSAEGEQLHLVLNGLEYAFLFAAPCRFEVSAKRKNSRNLQKLLEKMNSRYPEVKFGYEEQDQKVYATGYFTDQMSPDMLMEKVDTISNCFKQR